MKKVDDVFAWKGFGNGFGLWDSKCRLRWYEVDSALLGPIAKEDEKVYIAVATELSDNPGTPAHDCVENICILSINKYEIPIGQFAAWIEHSPAKWKDKAQATFSIVNFDVVPVPNHLDPKQARIKFSNPLWKPLKKDQVESLIGEALGD